MYHNLQGVIETDEITHKRNVEAAFFKDLIQPIKLVLSINYELTNNKGKVLQNIVHCWWQSAK